MISICIPTYAMNGKGVEMLKRCLDSIKDQTYRDFEIVISDNTQGETGLKIEELVNSYDLPIKYFYNPRNGVCANTNEALKHAKGDLIKVIYQDDQLADDNALERMIGAFNGIWQITGCDNNPNPLITGDLHKGNNKLGSPSCLTIKRDNVIAFDESLKWLLDCDYYKRLIDLYGEPQILNGVNILIGTGSHQVTNNLSDEQKKNEVIKLTLKYG